MITDASIPRDNGVLQLCHTCQRKVHFANGFLRLLISTLEGMAKSHGARMRRAA